jgi:hypothetical protein
MTAEDTIQLSTKIINNSSLNQVSHTLKTQALELSKSKPLNHMHLR